MDLFADSTRAKLDRLAAAMRTLHKALIDQTQREYERVHGKVANPYALLALLTSDPAFAWLRPMTKLIVEIEDKEADLAESRKKIDQLLDTQGEAFADRYLALVQSSPEIAVENGRFHAAIRGL